MKLFLAGGESRHWISESFLGISTHVPEIQGGRQLAENAIGGFFDDLPCREHNFSSIYRSDAIRGGFNVNDGLSRRSDSLWTEGQHRGGFDQTIKKWHPYILESFYYADADTERLIPHFGDFMLDSGAFTFCGTGGNVAWDEYLERYADFINRNNVQKFFELDIDSVVGYKEVKRMRVKLEGLTNKQPIPVWHISRGKNEFIRHCDEFPYVALGGYVVAIKASDPRQVAYTKSYPWFINEAHKRGKKIHGLGYTNLKGLTVHHFDSVDSTAWTTGNRFGYLYKFTGNTVEKVKVPFGCRIGKPAEAALINYTEWVKFQKWADTHL